MSTIFDDETEVSTGEHRWTLCGRLTAEGELHVLPLSKLPFRVGRRPSVELTLPRHTISGVHAEFYQLGEKLFLRDLKSTNGTFVNGQRLNGSCQLQENDLVQFSDAPFRVLNSVDVCPSRTICADADGQALAFVQFDQLLSGAGIIPHFQPIVDMRTLETLAYESLLRSRLVGLETPATMFAVAAELERTTLLSQVARRVAVAECEKYSCSHHLFLNIHPSELSVPELLRSCEELRSNHPLQPLTIEIHEGAVTEVQEMAQLRRDLDALGMDVAFDDFGAGQSRIAVLGEVRPRYLKFDRSLIRDLHTAEASHRHVIASLVQMAEQLEITPLAEGVETAEEHAACVEAGFVLGQGFYYARPMSADKAFNPARAESSLQQAAT